MRRRARKKLTTPYVRRLKKRDYINEGTASGYCGRISVAYYFGQASMRIFKQVYVLVQHGWPHRVMMARGCKQDIFKEIDHIQKRGMSIKEWQRHCARISRDSDLNRRRK